MRFLLFHCQMSCILNSAVSLINYEWSLLNESRCEMLSRFSTVIQNAVDALAPPVPLLDDFTYHWKMVMKFYVNKDTVCKTIIESTNIPAHLDQLLKILLEEEAASHESGTAGPCLEYLLQHRLLDLLTTLACTDCPPGMRPFTLSFIRRLITQLKHPLLPHISVYGPIQRLISLCNGRLASPTESVEIQFLCALCGLMCTNPHLTNIFSNQQTTEGRRLSTSSSLSSASLDGARPTSGAGAPQNINMCDCEMGGDILSCSCAQAHDSDTKADSAGTAQMGSTVDFSTHNSGEPHGVAASPGPSSPAQSNKSSESSGKVLLLEALLSFLHSADSRVVVKACEGVMVMASLPSDVFAHSVACRSDLCSILVSKLNALFAAIPPDIDPNDLDDMQVNWGLDSPVWTESSQFPGCRQVAAFLGWLDYCDQLVRESHPIIGNALASCVRLEFLDCVLGPALLEPGGADEVLITAFISKCLKHVSAPALLSEFLYWLVGDSREPELPGMSTSPVRQHLLNNCFHERDEVSLETLRLFEVLLEKPSEHVLYCLVLVYLTARNYYDVSASDSLIGSWSDEDERERQRESPLLDFSPGSSPVSRTLAPSSINKIINSFIFLLPQHLHSTTDPDESGYEQYVQDADRQYQSCIARCACYAWPTEATFPEPAEYDDSHSSDSCPEADHGHHFYEGPFLRMLFTRLPYEINLQLTGLVSHLAMLPHPYLHEYLLNPLLPVHSEANSLFSVLQLVAGELVSQVPTIKNYKHLLNSTRQKLLGDGDDVQEEENSLLESVVVLEEFCKEVAAITFVKFHHSS
ncbi:protein FAM160B1-like isoform X3 [Zootermopsis nevadensis]|uniref:protein FAM160B1-like isoform X3 n=1 Tax=Zootermopsis nevadensis TaxID=136037 RepID=UPI000B8E53FD|nr:protein FAM160B1-like isoform X3 [Zootermopsis nevadensis]